MKRQPCFHGLPAALLLALLGSTPMAAVIGIRSPAVPLTADRLNQVGPVQRTEWTDYLVRSQAAMSADKAELAAERALLVEPPTGAVAAAGDGAKSMPLNKAPSWYGSAEARVVADNIVSFQTPAGGWGKNQHRNAAPRLPGQWYVAVNPGAVRPQQDPGWASVGTIDNDAVVTEIRFLAKVADQLPAASAEIYRQSVILGLHYLLAAQFPDGGWPQVWPLQGGYHDALTLNDGALVNVAELMGDAAGASDEWSFVPTNVRTRAASARRRAIDILLKLQIRIDGRKTLWAQQYDALTLAPTAARNYEPAALASAESARVLRYLMSLPSPDAAIIAAVDAGVASLRSLAIEGSSWRKVSEADGKRLLPQPGAPLLWARYYDITTLAPIFGDRDGSIHDDVNEISLERRNGYAWFGNSPAKTIEAHAIWPSRRD